MPEIHQNNGVWGSQWQTPYPQWGPTSKRREGREGEGKGQREVKEESGEGKGGEGKEMVRKTRGAEGRLASHTTFSFCCDRCRRKACLLFMCCETGFSSSSTGHIQGYNSHRPTRPDMTELSRRVGR